MSKFQQRVSFEGYVGAIQALGKYEDTAVTNFRMRVPGLRGTGEGEDRQVEDVNGFWVSVAVWGRDAELINQFLRVGARVIVSGIQSLDEYESSKPETMGQTQTTIQVRADEVSLSLRGLEDVAFKPRKIGSDRNSGHSDAQPDQAAPDQTHAQASDNHAQASGG